MMNPPYNIHGNTKISAMDAASAWYWHPIWAIITVFCGGRQQRIRYLRISVGSVWLDKLIGPSPAQLRF